jgi:predicted ATPase with chaperone activity
MSSRYPYLEEGLRASSNASSSGHEWGTAYATRGLLSLALGTYDQQQEALEVQREIAKQARIANLIAIYTTTNSMNMQVQLRTRLEAEFPEAFTPYVPPRVQDAR